MITFTESPANIDRISLLLISDSQSLTQRAALVSLAYLKTAMWSYFIRCNRCDFAQCLPNPQIRIRYEATRFFGFGAVAVWSDDHFAWCSVCDGIVLCEHPNVLKRPSEFAREIDEVKAKLKSLDSSDDEYHIAYDELESLVEWKRFSAKSARKRSLLACMRCGADTSGAVDLTHPHRLPKEQVVALPLIEHPGCTSNGMLVQLSLGAIQNDRRFANTVRTLEYELAGVDFDHHGIRCIVLDAEGTFVDRRESS